MTDTAARCRHAIDIDDGACAAHAWPEAVLDVVEGASSAACMDDRRANNNQRPGDGVYSRVREDA